MFLGLRLLSSWLFKVVLQKSLGTVSAPSTVGRTGLLPEAHRQVALANSLYAVSRQLVFVACFLCNTEGL